MMMNSISSAPNSFINLNTALSLLITAFVIINLITAFNGETCLEV